MLDGSAQAISVGYDQRALARLQCTQDERIPIREQSHDCIPGGFRLGNGSADPAVARIAAQRKIAWVVIRQSRGLALVTAPPTQNQAAPDLRLGAQPAVLRAIGLIDGL